LRGNNLTNCTYFHDLSTNSTADAIMVDLGLLGEGDWDANSMIRADYIHTDQIQDGRSLGHLAALGYATTAFVD
jgi:hypothetical protein